MVDRLGVLLYPVKVTPCVRSGKTEIASKVRLNAA